MKVRKANVHIHTYLCRKLLARGSEARTADTSAEIITRNVVRFRGARILRIGRRTPLSDERTDKGVDGEQAGDGRGKIL